MSESLPALLGGTPLRPAGPPGWPVPDDDVRLALEAAYRDGSWGQYHGPHVTELTHRLAEFHQTEFVLTCGSGTFAVELALRALPVGPGDEVILAAYDYPGNFLNVHAVGAQPVLVDVAPHHWNLDPQRIAEAISPTTKALIVSHLHGGLAPMAEVMEFARQHRVAVIEDACQQPGALVQGKRAGTWGDVGVLSFGGSKLLTAGRGGALLTARADLHQRARLWQQRGNTVNPLSELQAAVLLPQLRKLDDRNRQRSDAARRLCQLIADVPGLRPFENRLADSAPGYYKLGMQFDADAFGLPRDRFTAAMRAEGIALDEGFRALHVGRSPNRFRQAGALCEARRAHSDCLVLHHPVLLGESAEIEQAAEGIRKVRQWASRLREG
ncbi:MAG: aminotransferase class V-fold PLP-dependent enzyme [Planctomycetia bacterium]|nr:aminotransferase class V-fold PLP-dependent enzyme [Planctomycetia bacterium]